MGACDKLIAGQIGITLEQQAMHIQSQYYWAIFRTLLFWFVGIRYTAFIQPSEVGSWIHVLGFVFLVVALIDTFFYLKKAWQEHSDA